MPFQQLTYEFGTLLVAWEKEHIVYLDFGLNEERARTYLQEETDDGELPKAWRMAFDRYATRLDIVNASESTRMRL